MQVFFIFLCNKSSFQDGCSVFVETILAALIQLHDHFVLCNVCHFVGLNLSFVLVFFFFAVNIWTGVLSAGCLCQTNVAISRVVQHAAAGRSIPTSLYSKQGRSSDQTLNDGF